MCVALVLLLNNFYKAYYALFEFCQHLIGALLLLLTVALMFVPLILNLTLANDDDQVNGEERQFVTIIVLFAGVVGGLSIVIIFVYFCKSCFKKRLPLSTTNHPEAKREHLRNIGAIGIRPLALPVGIRLVPPDVTTAVQYERFMPQPSVDNNNEQSIDLTEDNNYTIRNNGFDTMKQPLIVNSHSRSPTVVAAPDLHQQIISPPTTTMRLLTPSDMRHRQQPRALSADMHHLDAIDADEWHRRNSCGDDIDRSGSGGSARRPGTGRKLPQTVDHERHLIEHNQQQPNRYLYSHQAPSVSMNNNTISTRQLIRNNATIYDHRDEYAPRKQISSPLPSSIENKNNRQLYEHGHIYSRSWNVSDSNRPYHSYRDDIDDDDFILVVGAGATTPSDPDSDLSVPTHIDVDDNRDPYDRFYRQMQRVFAAEKRLPLPTSDHDKRASSSTSTSTTLKAIDGNRYRQAKSFETDQRRLSSTNTHSLYSSPLPRLGHSLETANNLPIPIPKYRNDTRSRSSIGNNQLIDNRLTPSIENQTNQQINECVDLWAIRSALEHNQLSATMANSIDDHSGSTSFESNTETIPEIYRQQQQQQQISNIGSYLKLPTADVKRQKYKNLLFRRQLINNGYNNSVSVESYETCNSGVDFRQHPIIPSETIVAKSFESSENVDANLTSFDSSDILNIESFESSGKSESHTEDSSQERKRLAQLNADSGYKSQSVGETQIDQQSSTINPQKLLKKGQQDNESFETDDDTTTFNNRGYHHQEIKPSSVTTNSESIMPSSASELVYYPTQSSSSKYYQYDRRDYSIDSVTDRLFRQFTTNQLSSTERNRDDFLREKNRYYSIEQTSTKNETNRIIDDGRRRTISHDINT